MAQISTPEVQGGPGQSGRSISIIELQGGSSISNRLMSIAEIPSGPSFMNRTFFGVRASTPPESTRPLVGQLFPRGLVTE